MIPRLSRIDCPESNDAAHARHLAYQEGLRAEGERRGLARGFALGAAASFLVGLLLLMAAAAV